MLALGWTAGGTVFEMWLGTVRPPKALSGNCGGPGQSDSRKVQPAPCPPPLTIMPPPFPASLHLASGS